MFSQQQIGRLIQRRSYRQLIETILPARRCRSVQAVEALARSESAEVAAVALALQRCCELSYAPSPLGTMLAGRLGALRRRDGLFGAGQRPSIGASAVALAAMLDWRDACRQAGFTTALIDEAIEHTVSALASLQESNGLLAGDAVGSAIALTALGDRPEFRAAVDVPRLDAAIDTAGSLTGDLSRYAHAMAA